MESIKILLIATLAAHFSSVVVGTDLVRCVSDLFDQKCEIKETFDQNEAIEIFNSHGGGKGLHVCQSVDGKSNKIFGEFACQQAIFKLAPEEEIQNQKIRSASCVDFSTHQTVEKKGRLLRKPLLFKVVKCFLDDNRNFYLINGPRLNFYYVAASKDKNEMKKRYRNSPTGEITHLLYLKLNAASFQKVELMETNDPIIADDIFGNYGTILTNPKLSINGHVCQKTPNGKLILNDILICEKAKKLILDQKCVIFYQMMSCKEKQIVREIIDLNTRQNKITNPFPMLNCPYFDNYSSTQKTQNFYIMNGPTPELYYILDEFGKIQKCIKL